MGSARRLTTILPTMTLAEGIETTRIHSVAGLTGDRTALVTTRPCRAPHQTISDAGLIGGGHVPMPGDVSLAHNGVLFLDELPEFRRHILEVLRQPLEDGVVTIARASMAATFPARITLVGALNSSLPLRPAWPSRESLYRHAPRGEKIDGARLRTAARSHRSPRLKPRP
jgi:magnesium chelatase family protein